jgi:uncharacterized membrane protein
MSLLKAGSILVIALCTAAASTGSGQAFVRGHHRHHTHFTGARPNPYFQPYSPMTEDAPGASYGGSVYQGEGFSRSTGGVNSMGNDFGTSGVLGHTNGMPSLPH